MSRTHWWQLLTVAALCRHQQRRRHSRIWVRKSFLFNKNSTGKCVSAQVPPQHYLVHTRTTNISPNNFTNKSSQFIVGRHNNLLPIMFASMLPTCLSSVWTHLNDLSLSLGISRWVWEHKYGMGRDRGGTMWATSSKEIVKEVINMPGAQPARTDCPGHDPNTWNCVQHLSELYAYLVSGESNFTHSKFSSKRRFWLGQCPLTQHRATITVSVYVFNLSYKSQWRSVNMATRWVTTT